MKVLIATPAYGGSVFVAYHDSVLRTLAYFQREFPGIAFESSILSLSMVTVARNILASQVLADDTLTHLLFIDADMGFAPSLIAKMLAFRKPVVGIVAPQRRLDYEAYHRVRAQVEAPLMARLVANDYVAGDGAVVVERGPAGQPEIEVVDGFVRVTRTGTGILLVERAVLEAMRQRFPELWVATPPDSIRRSGLPEGGLLQCFDQMRDEQGVAIGEDVSFCRRWTEGLQGEIWANIDEGIVHVGQDNYAGRYLSKLEAGRVHLRRREADPSAT